MEITVTFTQQEGQKGEFKIFIDGEQKDFKCNTSRILTNTSDEDSLGIFSKGEKVWFSRNGAQVTVECKEIKWESAKEVLDTIVANAKAVNEAYRKQYPAISESATYSNFQI